jgi:hypothetical protein
MELGLEIRMATRRDQRLNQDPVLDDKFEVGDMLVDFLQWTFPCYTISQEAFVGTLYGGWQRAKARSACGKGPTTICILGAGDEPDYLDMVYDQGSIRGTGMGKLRYSHLNRSLLVAYVREKWVFDSRMRKPGLGG